MGKKRKAQFTVKLRKLTVVQRSFVWYTLEAIERLCRTLRETLFR